MIVFELLADIDGIMVVAWYYGEKLQDITSGDIEDMERYIVDMMN